MKKRRINVLDVFLILLFLICIVGAALRYWHRTTQNVVGEQLKAELVLRISDVPAPIGECLLRGETLYDSGGISWAVVEDVRREGSAVWIEENGAFLRGEWDVDVRCDLFVRVETWGSVTDGTFFHNGQRACLVGQYLDLYSARVYLHAKIEDILLLSPQNGIFEP